MSQFDNVSVVKQANVYFDGKCVSHTVILQDGTRKSVGVILPSKLLFSTGAPEVMELIAGECKVTLAGEAEARTYRGGDSFSVPGESSFQIEVTDTLHYVCHFG
ncbi:pyrimidine/purine nucleoside phosphorylase [Vogesella urethralis]|uniref:pyrimidine/purine nucleoside phosphorylase n=1 Tax=Vogesella urethralis TaxID=2592656 RepID=UPI0011870385|nr:pyrimidine/purine nucleoside phosphorylase [Vogesella urethralis]